VDSAAAVCRASDSAVSGTIRDGDGRENAEEEKASGNAPSEKLYGGKAGCDGAESDALIALDRRCAGMDTIRGQSC
jgi:hypothetical protein